MQAEIIAVGTEILLGDIVNTHAQYLSKELAILGIDLLRHTAVGDNPERLKEAVQEAWQRCDLIFLTGGLGPTKDDLTKDTVCEVLGLSLKMNAQLKHRLEEHFSRFAQQMPQSNLRQAMVPNDAVVFENKNGTAPGLAIAKGDKTAILLPGPPNELYPMFEDAVRPFLAEMTEEVIVSHNLQLYGIGESKVDEILGELLDGKNPTVALYAKVGEVRIRITAKDKDEAACEAVLEPLMEEIKRRLGCYIYGIDVSSLEEAVVKQALACNKTIATAESCTGGMVAQKLTSIPGASACFKLGAVTYANEMKTKILSVTEQTLSSVGAVSRETAQQMALGALAASGADVAVSITGIAGPDGGTEEKPVGLVWIGIADEQGVRAQSYHFSRGIEQERETIRHYAAMEALSLLLRNLNEF